MGRISRWLKKRRFASKSSSAESGGSARLCMASTLVSELATLCILSNTGSGADLEISRKKRSAGAMVYERAEWRGKGSAAGP